jgi:hypothetical protein
MTYQRDSHGRRLFISLEAALAAQMRAVRDHGIWPGVIHVENSYLLAFDPEGQL